MSHGIKTESLCSEKVAWNRNLVSLGLPAIIFLLLMAVCWFTCSLMQKQIAEESNNTFRKNAAASFAEIESVFKQYQFDLYSLKSFFECSEVVTRQEFHDFTKMMITSHPGLQSICWIPNVPADQRQTHEAQARQQGYQNYSLAPGISRFSITPLSNCRVFYPIYHVEPFQENAFLLGRNLSSLPEWLSALQKAANNGLPATRLNPIMFSDQQELCIMLFYPVYHLRESSGANEKTAKSLIGFTAAVIVPQRDLAALINGSTEQMKLRLSPAETSNPNLSPDVQTEASELQQSIHQEIVFADLPLRAEVTLLKPYYSGFLGVLPRMLFFAGLLFSGLLALYVYKMQRQNVRTEEIVVCRTQELLDEQEKCRTLAAQAQMANLAKSEFLAGMSHEIRTPMNAIVGFAEILSEENMAPIHREYIKTIHESGQSLMILINDILDLSKIEAGRMQMEWMDCSLRDLLSHIEVLLRPQAEQKGLALDICISEELPEMIRLDPTRVRQCVMNLVGNAIKFTGSGYVQIHCDLCQAEQSWVQIEVKDTGIGIESDRLESIFKAFAQADLSTSRKFGGTGLGLSITRQLAELMEGSLTVSSTPSEGSIFTLRLPFRHSECGVLI